ncbi:MAG: hypothetical protein M3O20_14020 [Acidobacteriota bacterium]|nr:hypothetical protein [Acidobacteriota bacterium]
MYPRIASLVLLFAAASISMEAQQACSNSLLSGTYFYLANGSVISGGQALPFAELSDFVFDGNGGVTGQAATSDNGTFASFSFTGAYAVQAGCTGTLTLTVNPPGAGPFVFEVEDGGRSLSMAFSGMGAVILGRAYQVTTGTVQCGRGLLTGSYGFEFMGVSPGGLRVAQEGQMVSDGDSALTLNGVSNSNGTTLPLTSAGNYSLRSDCAGSASITSSSGNTNYLFAMVENGRRILFLETDAGTTISGQAETQGLTASVLPDFVFGGGFYSAIYFANTGDTAVSFPVHFIGDDGNPLTVPAIGGSTATIQLAPQGTAIVEAPNVGALVQGYASAFLPSGVVGYGVFRKSAPGIADQEVIVPLSSAASSRRTLIFDDTNYVTSVAIVNPSAVQNIVTVSARDDAGNLIGTHTILLGPNAKTAVVLRDLTGLGGIAGKRGIADFSVVAGNVAVLGLRFNGAAFSSIPTVNR